MGNDPVQIALQLEEGVKEFARKKMQHSKGFMHKNNMMLLVIILEKLHKLLPI